MKKIVVLVLIILILASVGVYLVLFRKSPSPNLSPEQTIPDQTELQRNTTIFKQDSNFAVEKPVETPQYKIEYDGEARGYYVTFTVADLNEYREVKKTAEKAFKDVGVADSCKLKIIFVVPKNIQDGFNLQDSLPSGCKNS